MRQVWHLNWEIVAVQLTPFSFKEPYRDEHPGPPFVLENTRFEYDSYKTFN